MRSPFAVTVVWLAALLIVPAAAEGSHVPDCFGVHPTNAPTTGDDIIVGTPGDDVLAGGAGDDDIRGMGANDILCGNEGNDRIRGDGDPGIPQGAEFDRIDGVPGDDQLSGGDILPPFCGLGSGSTENIVILPSPNIIVSGQGNDWIFGSAGGDDLFRQFRN